jgi:hypothetical protein
LEDAEIAQIMCDLQEREYEDSESSQEDDAESSQEDDTEANQGDAESSQESLVYPFGAQDEHGREPYTLFRQLSTPQASTPLLAIGQGNRISIRVDDQRISIRNGEVVQRPRGLVVMLHGVLPSRRRIGSRIATATGSMFQ